MSEPGASQAAPGSGSERVAVRVLYSFPHPLGAPGIGTTALHQVAGLDACGAEVTVVCTSQAAELPAGVTVHETLSWRGHRIRHRAFGDPAVALAVHDRRAASILRRKAHELDVVHTWPSSAIRTLDEARRRGVLSSREVPNTHTAHAFDQAAAEAAILDIAVRRGSSHRYSRRKLRREEREYADADLLLVPSEHVLQTFLDRGFDPRALRRHQYGFDPARFDARGRTDDPAAPFRAVFVGVAEPRKGLHYALQAWHESGAGDGGQFVIAGPIDATYRSRIAGLLDQPSVEERGFVVEVDALMRSADVLLLPSVEEGSALVTYEAQACGCIPLVSTAAGAVLPASVQALTHEPRDVATLTEQLRQLASDFRLRARLRADVLTAAPGLTWRSAAQRMLDIYRVESAVRRPR